MPNALEQAIIDFNKADHIEKTAKALREAARKVIIDALADGSIEAVLAERKGSSMTLTTPGEEGREVGVSVTTPTKKGLPSRFDQSQAERLYRLVEDTESRALDAFDVAFRLDEDRWMAFLRQSDKAGKLAELMLPFVLPATEDEEMSPRVAAL